MSRRLTAAEVLRAWERGVGQPPALRAIALLEPVYEGGEGAGDLGAERNGLRAGGHATADSLARLPVGRRDARLLDLREQTYGPHLSCVADCPACGDRVELEFETRQIRLPAPDPADPSSDVVAGELSRTLVVEDNGWRLDFRLPDTLDLMAAAGAGEAAAAKAVLLERCVLAARSPADDSVSPRDLPEHLVNLVARRMGEADPQADVQLAMRCPDCGYAWSAPFDIAACLWGELQAHAGRLLREVHDLAWAYGWREADILAMTAERRNAYLELARA